MIRPATTTTAAAFSGLFMLLLVIAGTLSLAPPAAAESAPMQGRGPSTQAPSTAPAPTAAFSSAPGDDTVLTLDSISPSVVPTSGPVRMSGTLTNTTSETMRDLNVHPFTSATPITTPRELQVAAESDPELPVGDRISTPGTFDTVRSLPAGETTNWSVRVPRTQLQIPVGVEGVYWIGAHVRGVDDSGVRTTLGRVRSFIPQVNAETAQPVDTSVIVPLRGSVRRGSGGKISDTETWEEELGTDGRLSRVIDMIDSAGSDRLTVALDPAVLDAAHQLADGNPGFRLAPTPQTGKTDPDTQPDDGSDSGEESDEASVDPASDEATAWLDRAIPALDVNPVLALPYGDLDVVAASRQYPDLVRSALRESQRALEENDLTGKPAVVPPSGLIDTSTLSNIPAKTEVFVSDAALPGSYLDDEETPSFMSHSGRKLAVIDSSASLGGPSPGKGEDAVALRQRLLGEAALRSINGSSDNLLMSLPATFDPGPQADEFFDGLDQRWIRLQRAGVEPSGTNQGKTVKVQELTYPRRQAARELDSRAFTEAALLRDAGNTLDSLLVDNDRLGVQASHAAFNATSYMLRDEASQAADQASDNAEWMQTQLAKVEIDAPGFVILSSDDGPFAPTITNGLDQPIEVSIRVRAGSDIEITAPKKIAIDAGGSQTVQLQARAESLGVHPVTLVVTDVDGRPTGAEEQLDIRSNTVGTVIWVVLGVGVGALFLAIPYRRWRKKRKANQPKGADAGESQPAGGVT